VTVTAAESAAAKVAEAERLLEHEQVDAWFEYLYATRDQPVARYDEVEGWAWARLQQRLRALATRRRRLR
jgi:hypothetical protein